LFGDRFASIDAMRCGFVLERIKIRENAPAVM
jgi:hypothetical protein